MQLFILLDFIRIFVLFCFVLISFGVFSCRPIAAPLDFLIRNNRRPFCFGEEEEEEEEERDREETIKLRNFLSLSLSLSFDLSLLPLD